MDLFPRQWLLLNRPAFRFRLQLKSVRESDLVEFVLGAVNAIGADGTTIEDREHWGIGGDPGRIWILGIRCHLPQFIKGSYPVVGVRRTIPRFKFSRCVSSFELFHGSAGIRQ